MTEEFAVETSELSKYYGELKAVDDVRINIPKGCIYGLIGPNGAGKTTLFKMFTGSLKPTEGTVKILNGEPGGSRVSKLMGYMPQGTALYEGLTVEENLDQFAGLYGLKGVEYGKRKIEILDFVGLKHRRKSMTSELSGGMKKRLSLGISILHSPELLLLDEPTVGVDPELKAEFWKNFRELVDRGNTIVITTHYLAEADRCDKIGMLYDGRLILEDSPEAVLDGTDSSDLEEAFLKIVKEQEGGD